MEGATEKMGKINVLDKNVAELIAAGEVIERPASIVKELLENSIDAGASSITVEIRRGGIGYIRVTDNGGGILPEDIPLAFLRHATSKIKLSDDLNFISTLGFRGEALASIAAVSRLELTSKPPECQFGRVICMEGGEQRSLEDAGCPDGTTIIVRDLFYNVPARLKFLKKDVSEGNTIAGIVDKIALSHPEISFRLISEHKVRMQTPGDGKLLSAIQAVFGNEFADGLIPVEYGFNGVSVKGYTSSDQSARGTRAMQHFFVNSRYVRSRTCMAALEEGYKNAIMVGKYPYCVLNVGISCDLVDVNVHPAKTEIRFMNERVVFDAVYFAVKSALSQHDVLKKAVEEFPRSNKIPNLLSGFRSEEADQLPLPANSRETAALSDSSAQADSPAPPAPPFPYSAKSNGGTVTLHSDSAPYHVPNAPKSILPLQNFKEEVVPKQVEDHSLEEFQFIRPEQLVPNPAPQPGSSDVFSENKVTFVAEPAAPRPREASGKTVRMEPSIEVPPEIPVRVIGELLRTYVVFEAEDTLFLMDKHAAHERILFEKLKRSVSTEERQLLLKPVVVSVSPEENQALCDHRELLMKMGFFFEEFGNNSLAIREVPLVLAEYDVADLFLDTAAKLIANKRDVSSDTLENLLHSIACRSAIKAHDQNSIEELTELLRQVYANDEIRHCPHGRPVVIAMTRSEIEKQFGRA